MIDDDTAQQSFRMVVWTIRALAAHDRDPGLAIPAGQRIRPIEAARSSG